MNKPVPPPSRDCSEKFWRNVDSERSGPHDCWMWLGHLGGVQRRRAQRYGSFWYKGRSYRAHRVAWYLTQGTWPDVLDHLCRNRLCVNPTHLEPVTNRENVLRGVGITAQCAKKTHCKRGHALVAPNLYEHPKGHRYCRECRKILNHNAWLRELAGRAAEEK